MNRSIWIACAAALIFGSAGIARADDRAEIDALYAKLAAALQNKTPEITLALETPDFKSIEANGRTMNGKQLVEQMKKQDATVQSINSVNISVKKAVITGKSARVTTDFSYDVVVVDKEGHMGDKGGTHSMTMRGIVKNDLVKTASGWKFKTMQSGTGKVLVDGKTVSTPKPGTTRKVRK